MATLPAVLGTDDLPLAELAAARLDGELVPLARGFTPVDLVVGPADRARAAALGLPASWVAELETAAWVWGARDLPPDPGRFCVPPHRRGANPRPGVILREIRLDDEGWTEVGGVRVTTPVRTIEALVRAPEYDAPAASLVERLIRIAGAAFDPEASLQSLPRLPYGRTATTRLRAALGDSAPAEKCQPAFTRATS